MKNLWNIITTVGSLLFLFAIGFFTGKGYEQKQNEQRMDKLANVINTWQTPNDLFVDSSFKYLDGHRLDIPDEISEVSWYDDEELDLIAAFIDDGGDIHFAFTGKTIPRETILNQDSLENNHSELTMFVRK